MLARDLESRLIEALGHFPVTLLVGARQVGKSTLVQHLCRGVWPARYLSLDDRAVLDAALDSPDGLVRDLVGATALDEVQRAPDLLRAVKREVDLDKRPGRFLLTGSANVSTLAAVSETLAGRVAVLELHPFSFLERHGRGGSRSLVDWLFSVQDTASLVSGAPAGENANDEDLKGFILSGGFPDPSLMDSASVRARWFDSFRQTYIERDVRDLAGLEHLPDFSRLMVTLSHRTATMLNFSELSREVGLPVTTLRRYFGILGQTYQVFTLPPFSANLRKRLVKTPKLYCADTGLLCHLTGLDDWGAVEKQSREGPLLETFVAAELRKALSVCSRPTLLSFWRTQAGQEVDFLLERAGRVVGIEVKWGTSIGSRDLAGLNELRRTLGDTFAFGLVLYRGRETITVADGIVAMPFQRFLSGSAAP